MATPKDVPVSKVSPSYLHSNSTSHIWPFSAVAELIDNAYDPGVEAKELRINREDINGKPCLTFKDNGAGMDQDHLLKMLSFGYCEKADLAKKLAPSIGQYGNGFKSGSMRLADDALVFTVCRSMAGVGLLSQSYLKETGADTVLVPLVAYSVPDLKVMSSAKNKTSLKEILKYSLFKSEGEIKAELRRLAENDSRTGTKIILYNLKRLENKTLELDFESDPDDIVCPEVHEVDLTSPGQQANQLVTSKYMASLRSYCEILYLWPRLKIYIRDVKVNSIPIAKTLSKTETDKYSPSWLKPRSLYMTFGFTRSKDPTRSDYGVMFYYKRRLIKAYEKLGYQKQANNLGVGVVGIVEVDCLTPIHNKQDFIKDQKYNSIVSAISSKLNDYWDVKGGEKNASLLLTDSIEPDDLWAQCDGCSKWRRLPRGVRKKDLPDKWYCLMNPDLTHNFCTAEEEVEEKEQIVQPSYKEELKKQKEEKRYKRKEKLEKKVEEAVLQRQRSQEAVLQRQRSQEAVLQRQRSQEAILHRQHSEEVISNTENDNDCNTTDNTEMDEAQRQLEAQKRLIESTQKEKEKLESEQQSLMAAAQYLQSSSIIDEEISEVASAVPSESPTFSVKSSKRKSSKAGKTDPKRSCTRTLNEEVLSNSCSLIEEGENKSIEEGENNSIEEEEKRKENKKEKTIEICMPKSPQERVNQSNAQLTVLKEASSATTSSVYPESCVSPVSEVEIMDLTLDDHDDSTFIGRINSATEEQDIKPDFEKLQQLLQKSSDQFISDEKNYHNNSQSPVLKEASSAAASSVYPESCLSPASETETVDLTLDSHDDSTFIRQINSATEGQDIKPNVEKLQQVLQEYSGKVLSHEKNYHSNAQSPVLKEASSAAASSVYPQSCVSPASKIETMDLTVDTHDDSTFIKQINSATEEQDIKPDVKKLTQLLQKSSDQVVGDEQNLEMQKKCTMKQNISKHDISAPENLEKDLVEPQKMEADPAKEQDVKPNVQELECSSLEKDRKATAERSLSKNGILLVENQTISSEEKLSYDRLKQKYDVLRDNLNQLHQNLRSLQQDVHHLLTILVPNMELGPVENIQNVVKEMIRANTEMNDTI